MILSLISVVLDTIKTKNGWCRDDVPPIFLVMVDPNFGQRVVVYIRQITILSLYYLRRPLYIGVFLSLYYSHCSSANLSSESNPSQSYLAQFGIPSIRDEFNQYFKRQALTVGQAENIINNAIRQQNWAVLQQILSYYEKLTGHDPILVDYARAALFRSQENFRQAISALRRIIAIDPDLLYVRLDLAIMLYENKEYEASEDQFRKVDSIKLPSAVKDTVDRYLALIQKNMALSYNFGVDFIKTNNVNDASYQRELRLGGLVFQKNEEALPRKAIGFGYHLDLNKQFSIAGNHYLTTNFAINGKRYNENASEFDETSAKVEVGYKYQILDAWIKIAPSVEQVWVADKSYMINQGIMVEYGQWLTHNWQSVTSYNLVNKNYAEDGQSYLNGYLQDGSLSLLYMMSPTFIIFGGGHYAYDDVTLHSESSVRSGINLGMITEFPWITTRLSVRYDHRQFRDNHSFFTYIQRADDEYTAMLSVWHRNFYFYGVTPKLNYVYRKVDSNIPVFYSRKNQQLFLTFEKSF